MKKTLKILLCINPFPEKNLPAFHHTYWIMRIDMFFGALMKEGGFEFSALLNEAQKDFWKQNHPESYARIKNFIALLPEQLKIFPDNFDATHKWFSGNYKPGHLKAMTDMIAPQMKDAPDLCIVFYHKAPYAKAAWPSAKIVSFYEGGFSRYPYMPTWRFDRTGCITDADTRELAILKGKPPAAHALQTVEKFRAIIGSAINLHNPFKAGAIEWRKKHKSLVLLPLQLSGRPAFDCLCPYKSQTDYLAAVLDAMPPSVGVVVTEHPSHPVITPGLYSDLTKRYPNFIYKKEFLEVENSSFFLTPLVDAVITVSSSVIWHAMLEGKLTCVLGPSDSEPLADCRSLKERAGMVDGKKPDPARFHNALHALLTRYWIPENLMKDAGFVRGYLEGLAAGTRSDIWTDEALLAQAAKTASKFKVSRRTAAQLSALPEPPASSKKP